MSYIEIDARGCGAGKTLNTIIPRIKQNQLAGIKTLLVVPSIHLQDEYRKHFNPSEIVVINSNNDSSVSEQLTMASADIVCITHQGFLQNEHRAKDNVDLIIDEAFDPYGQVTFNTHNEKGICLVDLSSVVEWKTPMAVPSEKPTDTVQPFYELQFDKSRSSDLLNHKYTQLQNPNLRLWCTWETHNSLVNKAPETTTFYTEYDAYKLLSGWAGVWIAAAAFNKTFMGAWIANSSIADYRIVHPFTKHDAANLTVHRPVNDFSLSKTFLKADKGVVQGKFRDYINANRTGKLFYNTNNDSTLRFIQADRITHNAHGLNGYSEYTEYAFASAIKTNTNFGSFLKQRTQMERNGIEFALAGYTAYQLLMRSALRVSGNTSQVNAYFMDTYQLNSILELFESNYVVKHIEGIEKTAKKLGRKANPNTMSRAQRQKEYRARKKAEKKL